MSPLYCFLFASLTLCLVQKRVRSFFHSHVSCNRFVFILLIYAAACTCTVQVCFSALPHWRKYDLKHLFTFQVYFLNNTRVNARFKANAKALNQFIYTILNPGKTLCAAVESHRSSFHFWPVAGKRHGNVCGELNRMKDNLYRNRLINTPRNQNRQTLPCCMKSVIMRAWCWGDSLGPDRG